MDGSPASKCLTEGKMQRLEYILFGYREYRTDDPRGVINLALKRGRTVRLTDKNTVITSLTTARILRHELSALGFVPIGAPRGIGGLIAQIPSHIPSVIALILATVIYFLSTDIVFDVRISGNNTVSEEQILNELSAAGFGVGSRWSKTNKNAVELSVLMQSDDIAWININREGRVAYVSLIELRDMPDPPPTYAAANIVAAEDCVIEEISVTRGTPVVKVGDTVRRGDLLISGIIEGEGGTEYAIAEGVVRGSSSLRLETKIDREYTETVTREGALATLTLKIFDFNINILQSYGNLPQGCVIIEEKSNITLLGRLLPISIVRGKYLEYGNTTRRLSDSELVEKVAMLHRGDINNTLVGRDLVSIRTDGRFTDGGYLLESLIVYSAEVGRVVEIKTEDK